MFDWVVSKTLWIILVPASIVCCLTLAVPIYLSFQTGDWMPSYEVNGAIGDLFGGIMNPAIAVLALVWLVKGVRIQQRELEETKFALQASERHQAAQVKISAITALISSSNDEINKLRLQRNSIKPDLEQRLRDHDEEQEDAGPAVTISLDDDTGALLSEFNSLEELLTKLEKRRLEYIKKLTNILETADGALPSMG